MSRLKYGNPKHSSRFICLCHLGENMVGAGIQRRRQREKYHIKDLMCMNPNCPCYGQITKNIEVRWCDDFEEIMEKATIIRSLYYDDKNKEKNDILYNSKKIS